ncbi:mitochondrial outer membrane protein [Zalerion maritima]|uniref:Mitochondrial outer membrane protein n=1 Tax=Zalerion maritima TaxID=339359 RepID=A0AAD5WPK3_9PEZI|nr:mitochondrial outer membrane protein [Zalerion maritima]
MSLTTGPASPLSLGPYHIISYATVTGTTFFHSFINGIVMFRTLERPQFASVQNKLFPIYFGMQASLPVLLSLTYPGGASPTFGASSSIPGVFDSGNTWTVLAPFATMLLTSGLNLGVLLPMVNKTMGKRYQQEKEDGKKSYDEGPHSEEMRALNKRFGMLHGVSSLLNLATFLAQVWYGFSLAGRLV